MGFVVGVKCLCANESLCALSELSLFLFSVTMLDVELKILMGVIFAVYVLSNIQQLSLSVNTLF